MSTRGVVVKDRNLDYEPGFWLTVLIILPAIVAVEVVLLFEKCRRPPP